MKRGTNYSSGGFSRITRLVPQVKMRVLGFFVVVACGAVLMAWVTKSLWEQLDQLQKDHAAVKTESFYTGVHLRGALRGLNESLLQYGASEDPAYRDGFLNEAADLKSWIATNQTLLIETRKLQLLSTPGFAKQLDLFSKISTNYDTYVAAATDMLSQTNASPSAQNFEDVYKYVRQISSSLFPLCNDLVQAEREAFGEFLRSTQETLLKHQRLLTFSWIMVHLLAVVLALLVYRGMIAPLRLGLRESTNIIERQEKLAALGVLGSGVAHEIRNPLTAIKFRLFSLKKALPAVADNDDLAVISGEIDRVEQIVQHFLRFARPPEPRIARVALGELLNEVKDLFKPELESAAIDFRMEVSEPLEAYADREQLKQVIINLTKNAAESIVRNGSVTLGLHREPFELDGRMRSAAVISVADTGKGIPAEVEARIFDPFFTTKDRGTGLGLAISARIAEKHGGLLRYETEVNEGTVFELVLPAIE